MDKGKLNYWVDVGLAISFFLVFFTGVVKWPALGFHINKWHPMSVVHDWSGLLMGLLVFVHLVLHWKWIVVMTKKIVFRHAKNL